MDFMAVNKPNKQMCQVIYTVDEIYISWFSWL